MRQWEQDIRLRALDGAVDLPATMPCPVCLEDVNVYAFRPTFRQPNVRLETPGRWLLRRHCARCHARRTANSLTRPETARWEDIHAAAEAEVLVEKARRLAERLAIGRPGTPALLGAQSRHGQRIMEPGTSPYDVASAQLEQELGRPEAQWTKAENLECTRRIYRLLGWDEEGLKRGSAADHAAKAGKAHDHVPAKGQGHDGDHDGDHDEDHDDEEEG